MKCLALYLRAPLQSWGVGAKFGSRPTMSFPSRSGILGMLAAASGVDRTNDRWLEEANRLALHTFVFPKDERSGGRLLDYHTVGGGNDDTELKKIDPWRYRMAVAKADGGVKTELTFREYLQDAAFGVIIADEGGDGLVDSLAESVQNPVWGVWLGRKACVPTEPIYAGTFDNVDSARDALICRGARNGRKLALQVTETAPDDAEENILDVPLSFARREYASRTIVTEVED